MNQLTPARQTFSLSPRTFSEAKEFAELMAASDMVPRDYKGKPGNILVAVQMGAELGFNPMQALQSISVIQGRPAVWGDGALALVRAHSACESVDEGISGTGDARAAWCDVKRKGQKVQRRTFSVADAKKAGLWGKPGPWQQYPDRMLQMRARGYAIRDVFPDALRGVITAEEAQDMPAATVVGFGATSHTEAISDARDQMLAMGLSYRVTFPNGTTRDYGDKVKAWVDIGVAAERCENLDQITRLTEDNAGLMETAPGEEVPAALQDLRDLISALREGLARAVPEHGKLVEPINTQHPSEEWSEAQWIEWWNVRAHMIKVAKNQDELNAALIGEEFLVLQRAHPEQHRELMARAAGKRANLEVKETLV